MAVCVCVCLVVYVATPKGRETPRRVSRSAECVRVVPAAHGERGGSQLNCFNLSSEPSFFNKIFM